VEKSVVRDNRLTISVQTHFFFLPPPPWQARRRVVGSFCSCLPTAVALPESKMMMILSSSSSIQAVRQLSAGKSRRTQRLFAWLAKGEEGGKLWKQLLRAESARGEEALRSPLSGGAHRGGGEHAEGFNSQGRRQGLGHFLTLN